MSPRALLDALKRDVTVATRVARRRPGFALAVVLTLGIGIGGNAAVFGLVRSVVLSALPYADSAELYTALEVHDSGRPRVPSYPTYLDWQAGTDAFEGLAFVRGAPLTFRSDEASGLVLGAFVTDDFFEVMGVPATVGRALTDDDYRPGADGAVVLSHRAWSRWFGADREMIGRTIVANELPLTVVGVMPSSFAYPDWGADNDLWIPLTQLPPGELAALEQRGFNADSRVVGRIGDGQSVEQVRAELVAIARALEASYPETNSGWTEVSLPSLKEVEVGDLGARLFLLWASVGLVMLICVLNLANLYLVHGASRQREYTIRTAIGAGRGRLFTQVLSETALLAALGGIVGIGVAALAIDWAARSLTLPRIAELQTDGAVIAVGALIAIASAFLFALLATRSAASDGLRPAMTRADDRTRTGTALACVQSVQVGATFVLLMGAWFVGSSLFELSRVDPGYDPAGLVALPVHPPSPAYDGEAEARTLYGRLLDAVATVPGVTSVGLTNHGPGGRAGAPTAAAIGRAPDGSDDDIAVLYRTVSAGYFGVVGMEIVAGREFGDDDLAGPEGPIVVNEALAAYWSGESAVGQLLGLDEAASNRDDFGEPILGRVVGVVANLHPSETGGDPVPTAYVPYTHTPWGQTRLLVRTEDATQAVLTAIESAVRDVDPALPTSGPFVGARRVADNRAAQRTEERLNTALLVSFATVALLLALVGMYGVVSYTVTMRTRALGVRLALGASPGDVVAGVLRRVAWMTAAGLVGGVLLAALASRAATPLLLQADSHGWAAYASVAAALSLLALSAGYLPARSAGRLDPARVLRED